MNNLIDITAKLANTDGFIDLILKITETGEYDNEYYYIARGNYKNQEVGLKIHLKKNISAGIVDNNFHNVFLKEGIRLQSIGMASDHLLTAMAELYGIDNQGLSLKSDLPALTCANLNQTDINYDQGEYRFKLFMETDDDSAELFVNFDFTKGYIHLDEKDMDYRMGVIEFLKD